MKSFIVILSLFSLASTGHLSAQPVASSFKHVHTEQNDERKPGSKALINSLAPRNDTFDIRHYNIAIDSIDFGNQTIDAQCILEVDVKEGPASEIPLDLLSLQVDSVIVDGINAFYQYNDTVLSVHFPSSIQEGQSTSVAIYYKGSPVTDPSGWGGFYFQGQHAYNLGVGFQSNPHNFGRAWFPCFDNFVERSTYEFHVRTDTAKKAFCNGLLQGTTHHGDGTQTWHWELGQTIPTYLVSMAVAPYATVSSQHTGIKGRQIPVRLAALPGDTADMKASFTHLTDAIDAFENGFGPFKWDRVGFVLVPFNSGAMEHATNIAFPATAANGSLNRETLMAHEFAHNWWGNLVTCQDAEDMWINEGWATYSEALFLEHVYGSQRYREFIRNNHRNVLQYAHVRDNGYRAVHGIPHDHTYGAHVYDKGADVAHTMRGYLPDSVFFDCLRNLMSDYAFENLSSEEFRDFMTNCSGRNFGSFFDSWVFNQGFPHFAIREIQTSEMNNGSYNVEVTIRQRLKEAPAFYDNVPLELTFFDKERNTITRTAQMSNRCGIFQTTLPFDPVYTALDLDEKISDATTDVLLQLDSAKRYPYQTTYAEVDVQQVNKTALMRVVHNWVGAEAFRNNRPGLHLSTERYWEIEGILPDGFQADAVFTYNGQASQNGGYLDHHLITNDEDSLVLMYRASSQSNWARADSFEVMKGFSANDKQGEIRAYDINKGQYALAIYDTARKDTFRTASTDTCSILQTPPDPSGRSEAPDFRIFPNPTDDEFNISAQHFGLGSQKLRLFNISGQEVLSKQLSPERDTWKVDTSDLPNGVYIVRISDGKRSKSSKKLVITNR